ncbi:MAG: cytochrome c peroxidase [Gammaproteobacteria bacterium]|nr:cytochrome c peroxidase [Gammaproteobacteria bacterium]
MSASLRNFTTGAALLGLALAAPVHADQRDTEPPGAGAEIQAPFYTGVDYEPPPPGSYRLPPLGSAADGEVLASDGSRLRLHDLFDGRYVLLSFIYSHCSDTNGCPLATAVLHRMQKLMAEDPQLAENLRLVSLSFDPEFDTPEAMELYGAAFRDGPGDWRFLTTASQRQLDPLLTAYGQPVIRDLDAEGRPLSSFSHILRVFLVDRERRIRNIYSVAFLYPKLIVNDVKTLLLEERAEGPPRISAEPAGLPDRYRPGDYKEGYESADYATRSLAVENRHGRPADLLALVERTPLGLPPVPVPAANPVSREKLELGRKLFYDRRLSSNDTFSCAICHIPEQGFTSHELSTAVGVEGRTVRRNSPTLYNVAYAERLFHDGREFSLEHQVWGPLLARNEMANPSMGWVLEKIRRMPDYGGLFEAAFPGRGLDAETLGEALATYQRALVSGNSPFDRWRYGGEAEALGPAARRGFELFTGKAGCAACHTVGDDYALFTDNGMHNTGVGYRESMRRPPERKPVLLAPGVTVEVDMAVVEAVSERPPGDVGLYEVTQDPGDRWKYRTPMLRNVALTAPYMHNGSLGTLREVVAFYNRGGVGNELLSPLIRPLGLTGREMDDLVAFLESLTGDNVELIIADAFAAPVGDITRDDPSWSHENRLR